MKERQRKPESKGTQSKRLGPWNPLVASGHREAQLLITRPHLPEELAADVPLLRSEEHELKHGGDQWPQKCTQLQVAHCRASLSSSSPCMSRSLYGAQPRHPRVSKVNTQHLELRVKQHQSLHLIVFNDRTICERGSQCHCPGTVTLCLVQQLELQQTVANSDVVLTK